MVHFNLKVKEQSVAVDAADPEELIYSIKQRIAAEISIEAGLQKYIYKGRVLADDATVSSANISEGDAIIVMKANTPSAYSMSAAAPAPDAAMAPAPIVPVNTTPTPKFNMAMHALLSNEETVAVNAVSLLLKIVSNIVNNPMEEKYRKMRKSNAKFAATLGNVSGGNACMLALGFDSGVDDWILVPSAQKWEYIVACKAKLEAFHAKMQGDTTTGGGVSSSSSSSSDGAVPTSDAAAEGGLGQEKQQFSAAEVQQQVLLMAMMQAMNNGGGGGEDSGSGGGATEEGEKET
jgi:hypothetical protein